MINKVQILRNQDIDRQEWERLLLQNQYASPFQSPDYYDFCNGTKNTRATVLAIKRNGVLSALCVVTIIKEPGIISYLTRRGVVYGGPLFTESLVDDLPVLLNAVEFELKREVIYLEVRNYVVYANTSKAYEQAGWNYMPYLNFRLSLTDKSLDDVVAGFSYNRRREVKLSLKLGAIYREHESMDEIIELYDILKELYKTRVKLPLPEISWFINFLNSGLMKVFVVYHNSKLIGGAFCSILRGYGIYTMYYCGVRDYQKNVYPTHLAVLAAIEYALNNNMKYLDFMGAGIKGETYGVRQYKSAFGGDLFEPGRYQKILNSVLYLVGKSGLELKKKLT